MTARTLPLDQDADHSFINLLGVEGLSSNLQVLFNRWALPFLLYCEHHSY